MGVAAVRAPEEGGDAEFVEDEHIAGSFDAVDGGRVPGGVLGGGGELLNQRMVRGEGGAGEPADGMFDGGRGGEGLGVGGDEGIEPGVELLIDVFDRFAGHGLPEELEATEGRDIGGFVGGPGGGLEAGDGDRGRVGEMGV